MRAERTRRRSQERRLSHSKIKKLFHVIQFHPLFILTGIWYAFTGDLLLFLMSALVATQHECAHAFAAAKLGYKLNKIVLMPFGAVIDGDMRGLSFKDEIFVAVCGPLCNLATAGFFVALWWFYPTLYAYTDTACYASLSVALVNILPAYPLDGGRVLKCALARVFSKKQPRQALAERKAERICRVLTILFSAFFFSAFFALARERVWNFTLLTFGGLLFVGGFGNKDKSATYEKLDVSALSAFRKGVEIRRVAVLESCSIKDALRFVARGTYLVLEVYDGAERHLFDLSQNELAELFEFAQTPYEGLGDLCRKSDFKTEKAKKTDKNALKKTQGVLY